MSEADARKKYPELFEFGTGTHRLRIVIHDKQVDADKGKEHIAKVAPSVPGLTAINLKSVAIETVAAKAVTPP